MLATANDTVFGIFTIIRVWCRQTALRTEKVLRTFEPKLEDAVLMISNLCHSTRLASTRILTGLFRSVSAGPGVGSQALGDIKKTA
jgi:hypothetical protein